MNDVLDKFDELVDYIKNSYEYQQFLLLKDKISSNKDIMDLIDKVKLYQRRIVKNIGDKKENELIIDDCMNKLNNYPIYVEFNYLQKDLDVMFQNIKNMIDKYFMDCIN